MIEKLTPEERQERAKQLFLTGYNCSQAVVLTFADLLDVDEESLSKIASPFGGGMGRLRKVCGAFSGMMIVLGLLYGYGTPETGEKKTELYTKVQELAEEVEKLNGSIECCRLLNKPAGKDSPQAEPRTADFYKKRPCTEIIGKCALVLAEFIGGTTD